MPINDGNYARTLYDTITTNDIYTATNTIRWEPYPDDVREIPTVYTYAGNEWTSNKQYSMESLIREEVAKYMRKLFALLRDYKYISADIKEEEFIALLNEASNE